MFHPIFKLTLILLILHISFFSFCQSVWDGGAGTTSWHDADNWNTNSIPSVLNDVVINIGDQVVLNSDGFAKSINVKGSLRLGAGQLLYVSGSSGFGYRNDGGTTEILGTLLIDQTNVQGFINRAGGIVTVEGTISAKDQIGTIPVHNFGGSSLLIASTGSISIGQCSGNGITNNGASTSFVNEGAINFINGISGEGIYNGGGASFENKNNGNILIKSIGINAIVNTGSGSSFINKGDLQVNNMNSDVCLKNLDGANFENLACGLFTIQDSIYNEATWSNSAFVVNTFARKMESSGTMTNSGLIQDIENSFENLLSNSGHIVNRTTNAFTHNYSDIGLVQAGGGPYTVTFGNQVYLDENLTQSAGAFNPTSLEWTPSNVHQTTIFFIQANITGQNCPLTIQLETSRNTYPENQQIVWVGNKGDWDVALNWNYERVPLSTDTILIPNNSDTVRISSGLNEVGTMLENNGVLRILSGGSLSIDGSLSDGIKNNNIIENYGIITAENTGGNGIANNDTMYNYGSINLPQGYVWSGLLNSKYFLNDANASILIQNSDRYGITNTGMGSKFDNEGNITVAGTFGDYSFWNVNNSSVNNKENGNIYLQGSGGNGLYQLTNAVLTNDGLIFISDNFSSTGILNASGCTIVNNACGTIKIRSRIASSSGVLENYGLISQDYDNTNFDAGVSNFGFIEDLKNSFDGLGSNSGYRSSPVNGTFKSNEAIANILDFNTDVPNIIIDCEWYVDRDLSISAGPFVEVANTWTPNLNSINKDTFYFKVSTTSPGCLDTISITFEEKILPNPICGTNVIWVGNSGNWEDPKNWNVGRTPGICDTILIQNLTDTVQLSQNIPAYCSQIISDGSIVIKMGDSLTVSGSDAVNIFMHEGTIYNNGYLNSSNATGDCIDTDSDIENVGEIVLSDCFRGLDALNSQINNYVGAILTISNTEENAVYLYGGEMDNGGVINIGKQVMGFGIRLENSANLMNQDMAILLIQNADRGMDILAGSNVNNSGNINIDSSQFGIVNYGNFVNESDGHINITQTSNDAFSNSNSLINNGQLSVLDGILSDGLNNVGTLVNNAGAVINIEETSESGIAGRSGSVIQNYGVIMIGVNVLGNGISLNNATLTNEIGASIGLRKSSLQTVMNFDSNIILKTNSNFTILEY